MTAAALVLTSTGSVLVVMLAQIVLALVDGRHWHSRQQAAA